MNALVKNNGSGLGEGNLTNFTPGPKERENGLAYAKKTLDKIRKERCFTMCSWMRVDLKWMRVDLKYTEGVGNG